MYLKQNKVSKYYLKDSQKVDQQYKCQLTECFVHFMVAMIQGKVIASWIFRKAPHPLYQYRLFTDLLKIGILWGGFMLFFVVSGGGIFVVFVFVLCVFCIFFFIFPLFNLILFAVENEGVK